FGVKRKPQHDAGSGGNKSQLSSVSTLRILRLWLPDSIDTNANRRASGEIAVSMTRPCVVRGTISRAGDELVFWARESGNGRDKPSDPSSSRRRRSSLRAERSSDV